jgi:hypothetical protein
MNSFFYSYEAASSGAAFLYLEDNESYYWLQIIEEAGLQQGESLTKLIREANELTAIFTATDKTASKNK